MQERTTAGSALGCQPRLPWTICQRYARHLRRVLFVALTVVAVVKLGGHPPEWLMSGTESTAMLVAACVVYAVLLAIPFIPSVEIGLVIMVLFGAPGALGAYLATLAGLNVAYHVGRLLGRNRDLKQELLPGSCNERLARLGTRFPKGCLPVVSLVMLLNMPGNTAVGGGGGVAMLYGASRLVPWPVFAATVAVATAVVPLLFVTGILGTEHLTGTAG